MKLKTISNRDILREIETHEKLKRATLIKIFSHNHQKLHQIYSKNENHIYNEDDEKYSGFFQKMKKYNEISKKNILDFHKKKDENKNFYKQYIKFKKNRKEICNDGINFLYGNLLPKYSKKKFGILQKISFRRKTFQRKWPFNEKKK